MPGIYDNYGDNRRRQARTGQVQTGQTALQQGGILNALRQEWKGITRGPLIQGVRQGFGMAGRAGARFGAEVGANLRRTGEFTGSPTLTGAGRTSESYWRNIADRYKPGVYSKPGEDWVTGPGGPEAYRRSRGLAAPTSTPDQSRAEGKEPAYKKPEAAEVGADTSVQRGTGVVSGGKATKEKETKAVTSGLTQPLPGPGQMNVPELPEFISRGKDVRKYQDIANMSLDQWNKYWSKMPAGERPIHEIRGTAQSWWSPKTSESYATRAGAVTGLHGQAPTVADIIQGQIEAFKQKGSLEQQRYASQSQAQATTTAARIRAEADIKAAVIRAEESAKTAAATLAGKTLKLSEYDTFKVTDQEGNETVWMYNKAGGHKTARPIGELGIEALAGFFEKAGAEGASLSAEWISRIHKTDPEFAKQIMSHIAVNDPDTASAISEYAHGQRKKEK